VDEQQLPSGYRSRPATLADAAGVAAAISAVEAAHGHGTATTVESLRTEWEPVDLEAESVLIEASDGTVVAYADVLNHAFVSVNVYAYVHPKYTGRGLGRFLMRWGEQWALAHSDQAPAEAQVDVRQFIVAQDSAAQELLQAHGYEAVRSTWVMQIVLDEEPPEPEWPEGIRQAPYRPGVDERDVFETVESAFQDVWGRPANTFDNFQGYAETQRSHTDLWIVARAEDGRAAGTCLGEHSDGHGWISSVGVRREYRGRGLGLALLHACFGTFYLRGVRDIRLSVDAESLTGAPRLYERAGMHPLSTYILHRKILRPGVDFGERVDA